ncbi:MAG: AIR synthase related protein [Suilimivivens sp.]
MKKGKISESVLKRSVLKYIHTQREEVIKGAGMGSDCAFLKYENILPDNSISSDQNTSSCYLSASTETIALPVKDAGSLAVYAAVNNLAAGGTECFAVTVSLSLPLDTEEYQLQEIMKQIESTCSLLHVQIAGGHTEVTGSVNTPVITVTALGRPILTETFAGIQRVQEGKCKVPANTDIVMTKWIGLEGTVILSKEKEKDLLARYPLPLIAAAQGFEKYLPILPEAATALKSGVYTMHDIRNGGVFGGLWELSRSMGVGLSVDLKKIPVKQETIEICEFFDLNPYELLSGGSLLMIAHDGEGLVWALNEQGISAAVIGQTTDSNDKIILNDEEIRFLEPAKPDEILKVFN